MTVRESRKRNGAVSVKKWIVNENSYSGVEFQVISKQNI
jgi:hypothetical protein